MLISCIHTTRCKNLQCSNAVIHIFISMSFTSEKVSEKRNELENFMMRGDNYDLLRRKSSAYILSEIGHIEKGL